MLCNPTSTYQKKKSSSGNPSFSGNDLFGEDNLASSPAFHGEDQPAEVTQDRKALATNEITITGDIPPDMEYTFGLRSIHTRSSSSSGTILTSYRPYTFTFSGLAITSFQNPAPRTSTFTNGCFWSIFASFFNPSLGSCRVTSICPRSR